MDKIPLPEWSGKFGSIEHHLLTQNDRYTEAIVQFKEPGLAQAEFSIIQMPGLALNHVLFNAEEPLQLDRRETQEGAESIFVLDGCIHTRFDLISTPMLEEERYHGLHYNQAFSGEHKLMPGRFEAYQINFDLSFFKSIVQGAADRLMDSIGNSLERKEPFLILTSDFQLEPYMFEIIQSINNCRFSGITKCMYLEAKAMELFTLQVEQFSKKKELAKDFISNADKEKLKAVRAFIQTNYLLPLSLAKISTEFGLNEFKLKKGYKELFHTTVFGHIHHFRMHKAKQLLEEGNLNISQVSDLLGYSNIAAFSGSFKKKFGYAPSRYVKANLVTL